MAPAHSPSDFTPWCTLVAGDEPGTFVCTRKGCRLPPVRSEAWPIWRQCGAKASRRAQRERWPQDQPERGCCGELVTMATNLAVAAYKAAKALVTGQGVKRKRAEADRCLALCRTCEQYRPATKQCGRCLCFVEAKVLLQTEHCPLEKW